MPLPAHSGRSGRGVALWFVLASLGTVAVWRLSAYIESLTALGRTDRAAASALFKSRVLPAVGAIAGIAIVAGLMLVRQGLHSLRAARLAEDDGAGVDEIDPEQRGAWAVGILFMAAGGLIALVPVTLFAIMVWAVR